MMGKRLQGYACHAIVMKAVIWTRLPHISMVVTVRYSELNSTVLPTNISNQSNTMVPELKKNVRERRVNCRPTTRVSLSEMPVDDLADASKNVPWSKYWRSFSLHAWEGKILGKVVYLD